MVDKRSTASGVSNWMTTDIPSLPNWGEPLLVGPGSIHVAHTEGEFIEKRQLTEAVEIYCALAKRLSGND